MHRRDGRTHRRHRRAGRAGHRRHRRDGRGTTAAGRAPAAAGAGTAAATAAAVVTTATAAAAGTAACRGPWPTAGTRRSRHRRDGVGDLAHRRRRDGAACCRARRPGRGAPGRGAPGRGAGGRGIGRSTGCAEENGLLPTRGVRPPGFGRPGAGRASVRGGRRGRRTGLRLVAGAGAGGGSGSCGAGRWGRGLGSGGFLRRAAGACIALTAALGAAAPLPARLVRAGLPPPNDSRSRRATGASTVDDADLTNSPCSLSRARTSLLVTPSSLANSCTRALPATTSPVYEATAVVGRASGLAMTHGHRDFTVCSCLCCLFCWRDDRAHRETRSARPPLTCPVRRRCAALEQKLAAGSLLWRTAVRDAAMHPAPAEYLLGQRSRRICRSRSTQPPLGAVRQPTLAYGTRRMSAPVLRYVDAPRPKSRAGSRLSLPAPNRCSIPPAVFGHPVCRRLRG